MYGGPNWDPVRPTLFGRIPTASECLDLRGLTAKPKISTKQSKYNPGSLRVIPESEGAEGWVIPESARDSAQNIGPFCLGTPRPANIDNPAQASLPFVARLASHAYMDQVSTKKSPLNSENQNKE